MDKERQRKLAARERRQAALGHIGTPAKELTTKIATVRKFPINHVVPKPVDVDHVKKVPEVQHIEKRGRGRPRKNMDLPVSTKISKKTDKDKRKNK